MTWLAAGSEEATGWLSSAYSGLGVPASQVQSSAYFFEQIALLLIAPTSELRAELISPPTAGTLALFEDGSYTFTGAPDGDFSFDFELFVDGLSAGVFNYILQTGSVNVFDVYGVSDVALGSASTASINAVTAGVSSVPMLSSASLSCDLSASGISGVVFVATSSVVVDSTGGGQDVNLIPARAFYKVRIDRGFVGNLAQGADYSFEMPFTLNGQKVDAVDAVEFSVIKNGQQVFVANLCSGALISDGVVIVKMSRYDTSNMVGTFDFELWMKPISDPDKSYFIQAGKLHFQSTVSRITKCQ